MQSKLPEKKDEFSCPSCHMGKMLVRESKHGKFYGCSNFPECRCTHKWVRGLTLLEQLEEDERKKREFNDAMPINFIDDLQ